MPTLDTSHISPIWGRAVPEMLVAERGIRLGNRAPLLRDRTHVIPLHNHIIGYMVMFVKPECEPALL